MLANNGPQWAASVVVVFVVANNADRTVKLNRNNN